MSSSLEPMTNDHGRISSHLSLDWSIQQELSRPLSNWVDKFDWFILRLSSCVAPPHFRTRALLGRESKRGNRQTHSPRTRRSWCPHPAVRIGQSSKSQPYSLAKMKRNKTTKNAPVSVYLSFTTRPSATRSREMSSQRFSRFCRISAINHARPARR